MKALTVGMTAGAIGSLAGVVAASALVARYPAATTLATSRADAPVVSAPVTAPAADVREAPIPPDAADAQRFEADPIADLRKRRLDVPVQNVSRAALVDSFDDARNGTDKHEAIDILAPRNTPVVAVEDGTIAKLFLSVPGGITIYQFDSTTTYVYYYAHLERYANGLTERARVTRGQVLGYVGTSGNAPKNAAHLHFEIIKLTEQKQWWRGTSIDPYPVLK
jgi:murein DD-endopeptidase MepM/ murein hydrolase activator NlpD